MAEINENIVYEKKNTVLFAESLPSNNLVVSSHQRSFQEYMKSWSEKADGAGIASQDIISMLSRPGLLKEFEWKETDEDDTLLTTVNIPTDIANTTFKTLKLKYFKFIRSDFKIRVVINATRFHAGRLLVVWAAGTSFCANSALNEKSMGSLLCFPNAIIDPATNQSVELTIPFISPYLYQPVAPSALSNADLIQHLANDMGTLKIFVLNKLSSGQTAVTPVSVTVYGWFDKPVLSVPVYAQMGVVSDTLDGLVAPMSEIVTTATEGVAAGSRMLRTVGLSKPDNIGANVRMTPVIGNSTSYGVGSDTVEKLVVDPKCALEPCNELFGTVDDEMDVVYIGKTWSLLGRFDWKATDAASSEIALVPMYPEADTTLGWFLRAFKYYCGNIRVRIQVVANQFMTGRIMAVFSPFGIDAPNDISMITDMMYNQVYDLTGTSESQFTIPWNAPYPVLPTRYFAQSDIPDYCGIDQSSIGTLKILVVNPLRTTKATTEVAHINLYMSFDDDFEVYWPTLTPITGYISANNQSITWDQLEYAPDGADSDTLVQFPTPTPPIVNAPVVKSSVIPKLKKPAIESTQNSRSVSEAIRESSIVGQSGVAQAVTTDGVQSFRIETEPNPLWKSKRTNGFAATYNFGERITNLRQVLKRYSVSYHSKSEILTASSVPSGSSATSIIPYVTYAIGAAPIADKRMTQTGTTITANDAYRVVSCWTFLSYFGCMYRYQRGGVRLKFLMGTQPCMSVFAAPGPAAYTNVPTDNPFVTAPSVSYVPIFPVSTGAGVDQFKYARNAFLARKTFAQFSEGGAVASCDINPNLEIEIPYYSPFMMVPTPSGCVPPTATVSIMRAAGLATLATLKMNRTVTLYFLLGKIPLPIAAPIAGSNAFYNPSVPAITVLESVADDFQFGFLTGPPLLQPMTAS